MNAMRGGAKVTAGDRNEIVTRLGASPSLEEKKPLFVKPTHLSLSLELFTHKHTTHVSISWSSCFGEVLAFFCFYLSPWSHRQPRQANPFSGTATVTASDAAVAVSAAVAIVVLNLDYPNLT